MSDVTDSTSVSLMHCTLSLTVCKCSPCQRASCSIKRQMLDFSECVIVIVIVRASWSAATVSCRRHTRGSWFICSPVFRELSRPPNPTGRLETSAMTPVDIIIDAAETQQDASQFVSSERLRPKGRVSHPHTAGRVGLARRPHIIAVRRTSGINCGRELRVGSTVGLEESLFRMDPLPPPDPLRGSVAGTHGQSPDHSRGSRRILSCSNVIDLVRVAVACSCRNSSQSNRRSVSYMPGRPLSRDRPRVRPGGDCRKTAAVC